MLPYPFGLNGDSMNDESIMRLPSTLEAIENTTRRLGFPMASDRQTGCLLRTLAASKPKGHFLELGTGTGLSASWLLDGMCEHSVLKSVDKDLRLSAVAEKHLGQDSRVEFVVEDGLHFLKSLQGIEKFDLIFADTWPGKYDELELALALLKRGGLYVIDDMMPQSNWPDDHPPKVRDLLQTLENLEGYQMTSLCWSTGIVLVVKQ